MLLVVTDILTTYLEVKSVLGGGRQSQLTQKMISAQVVKTSVIPTTLHLRIPLT